MTYITAVFAPLFGAMFAGLLGKWIGDKPAQAVSILCMLLAAACGRSPGYSSSGVARRPAYCRLGHGSTPATSRWTGRCVTTCSSATMVAMVTFVSMLIHVYSIGYMAHDEYPRYRFFAYMSLFTFAMLMLVTATICCSSSSAGKASASARICSSATGMTGRPLAPRRSRHSSSTASATCIRHRACTDLPDLRVVEPRCDLQPSAAAHGRILSLAWWPDPRL